MSNDGDLSFAEFITAVGVGIFGGIAVAAILEALFGKNVCPKCKNPINKGIPICPNCSTQLGWN